MRIDIESIVFPLGTQKETTPGDFTLLNKRIVGLVITSETQPDYTCFRIRSGGKTFFPLASNGLFVNGLGIPLQGYTLPQPPTLFSTNPVKNHLIFELDFIMDGPPYRLSIQSDNAGMGWGVDYCLLFLTTNDLDFQTQMAKKVTALRSQLEKLFGNDYIQNIARGEFTQGLDKQ